jgi:hypothetical protein
MTLNVTFSRCRAWLKTKILHAENLAPERLKQPKPARLRMQSHVRGGSSQARASFPFE